MFRMLKHLAITLLLFLSIGGTVYPQDQDTRLSALVHSYGQAEVSIVLHNKDQVNAVLRNFSVSSYRDDILYLRISPLTLDSLLKSGFTYNIIPLQYDIHSKSKALTEIMEWDSYPSYDQYIDIMRLFAEQHPDLCRPAGRKCPERVPEGDEV